MKKTAENVTIRAITEADRQEWLSLWQQYQHFYRAKITPEVTANTFSALCEGKDICGLVAVDGSNRLLGFMHIVYHASYGATETIATLKISLSISRHEERTLLKSCLMKPIVRLKRGIAAASTG